MKKIFIVLALMFAAHTAHAQVDSQLHRYSECSIAGKNSTCEPEVVSSHYDFKGNLHVVYHIHDKQHGEQTIQIMYKPVGQEPIGTGDDNYK